MSDFVKIKNNNPRIALPFLVLAASAFDPGKHELYEEPTPEEEDKGGLDVGISVVNVEAALGLISSAGLAELEVFEEDEKAAKKGGGRKAILEAIEERRAALKA